MMDPEELAKCFHSAYERLAPEYGYKTREASAKPWAEVPENNRRLMTAVCAEILPQMAQGKVTKHTSDGHHTFDELYQHRFELWLVVCRFTASFTDTEVWRCKLNSDGTSWDGWFLLGMDRPKQITYHLPIRLWDRCYFAVTYEEPHDWDGHTSADVLERLKEL